MDPIVKRVYPEGENLRIVEPRELPAPAPTRSHWQQRRDEDLAQIEEALRTARDLVADALEGIASMGLTPQHKSLEILIGQQLEQILEYRRARG